MSNAIQTVTVTVTDYALGARAMSAIEIYFLDPIHAEDPDPCFIINGNRIFVHDPKVAFEALTNRANACDEEIDHRDLDAEEKAHLRAEREALTRLASKILMSTKENA